MDGIDEVLISATRGRSSHTREKDRLGTVAVVSASGLGGGENSDKTGTVLWQIMQIFVSHFR